MLLLGEIHQDAVVAFEQQIVRDQDGILHSNVVCDGCGTSIRLPGIRYVCQSCEEVDLCSACHHNYELEGLLNDDLPTCQDHDFLAVPRDEWSALPPGAVSADGTTAEKWMKNLLVSFSESSFGMRGAAILDHEESSFLTLASIRGKRVSEYFYRFANA
jgi:hypothetical protein